MASQGFPNGQSQPSGHNEHNPSTTISAAAIAIPTSRRQSQEDNEFSSSMRLLSSSLPSSVSLSLSVNVSSSIPITPVGTNRDDESKLQLRYSQSALRNFRFSTSNTANAPNYEDDLSANFSAKLNLNLAKKSVSEEENTAPNGIEIRPNKLFPVQNERDELLRKVRSVLNRVSPANYSKLRKQWLGMMPDGEDEEGHEEDATENKDKVSMSRLGEVLQLVIAKALDDTIYMHIYAGLMGCVVARKSGAVSKQIRQTINAQLHHDLQKMATDKELGTFHRAVAVVDQTRRRKVTLHRLIAEFYCERACTSKFLNERIADLLVVNNPSDIDENVECLCVLMTFAGQKLETVKSSQVETIFSRLQILLEQMPELLSKRILFMVQDLIEMRSTGWSPHGKWWSPSASRAPEGREVRERTLSEGQQRPPGQGQGDVSEGARGKKGKYVPPKRQSQSYRPGPGHSSGRHYNNHHQSLAHTENYHQHHHHHNNN